MLTAVLVLLLLSVWIGFYQIVKQQGRILLRLDNLEQQSAAAQAAAVAAAQGAQVQAYVPPPSLDVGAEFPVFALPDLDGKTVSLADFRGKSVLLVHWNPDCGFCDMVAPELARFQPDFEKRNVQLLLLAHGDAGSNRKLMAEHGLKCPVLLYNVEKEPADATAMAPEPLRFIGTPAAYLLDGEGRVARALVVGANDIPGLAAAVASGEEKVADHEESARKLPGQKPLSQSNIVRDGLKAGTPAPVFTLPDIHGETVALERFRGRRVLLVFSDPNCGPCDALAPQLAKLHSKHANNGMAFVMVGRGNADENRKKANQHGLKFPVVLQEKWKLSKEYGIFATPVAFLVDEEGIISKDVAVGADPILALAEEGLRAKKDV